jgi:hypothetical protein
MRKNRELEEPFVFAWIREMLPAETELADEPSSLSDQAFWLVLLLAGIAALIYALASGFFTR